MFLVQLVEIKDTLEEEEGVLHIDQDTIQPPVISSTPFTNATTLPTVEDRRNISMSECVQLCLEKNTGLIFLYDADSISLRD